MLTSTPTRSALRLGLARVVGLAAWSLERRDLKTPGRDADQHSDSERAPARIGRAAGSLGPAARSLERRDLKTPGLTVSHRHPVTRLRPAAWLQKGAKHFTSCGQARIPSCVQGV